MNFGKILEKKNTQKTEEVITENVPEQHEAVVNQAKELLQIIKDNLAYNERIGDTEGMSLKGIGDDVVVLSSLITKGNLSLEEIGITAQEMKNFATAYRGETGKELV